MDLYFFNNLRFVMSDRQFQDEKELKEQIGQPPKPFEQTIQTPTQQELSVKKKTSKALFMLFSYLYLLQGMVLGVIATMPYVYKKLPDYDTMALFGSVSLPYSFKFIIAPFLQKFSIIQYGKRKFWIMNSQTAATILIIIGSFFTDYEQATNFAILCIFIQICMVVQNIALHSLIIKQIPCPQESSLIQSYSETLGILIGGLVMLKATSHEFANLIGLTQPLANPKSILIAMALFIFVSLIAIHCLFHETVLNSQRQGQKFTFCQIIRYYSVFIQSKSKYFRFCIFVLVINQGFNFFNSLYDYELVNAGFSRDTSNTIGNIVIIPIIILTFYMAKWTKATGGVQNALMISMLITIVIYAYVLAAFPLNPWVIGIISFITGLLDSWRFFIGGVLINQFPVHALSGMYITVLGSYFNFGRLTFFHTEICGIFGWKLVSGLGLFLQFIIVLCLHNFYGWVINGQVRIPKGIQYEEQVQQSKSIKNIL